jgi:hypothetical protein
LKRLYNKHGLNQILSGFFRLSATIINYGADFIDAIFEDNFRGKTGEMDSIFRTVYGR